MSVFPSRLYVLQGRALWILNTATAPSISSIEWMNEWMNSSNVMGYEQLFFLKEEFLRMVLSNRAWNGSVISVNIRIILNVTHDLIWLPWWLSGKESACNAGDSSSIPGSRRPLGGGNGIPLQYSCLGIPRGQRSLVGYSSLRSQRVWHEWAHIQRWSPEHCEPPHPASFWWRIENWFPPAVLLYFSPLPVF